MFRAPPGVRAKVRPGARAGARADALSLRELAVGLRVVAWFVPLNLLRYETCIASDVYHRTLPYLFCKLELTI